MDWDLVETISNVFIVVGLVLALSGAIVLIVQKVKKPKGGGND